MYNFLLKYKTYIVSSLSNEAKLFTAAKVVISLKTAVYLCSIIICGLFYFEHADYNTPEFVLETDYIHWTTNFPGISVCQVPDASFVTSKVKKMDLLQSFENSTEYDEMHQFSNGSHTNSVRKDALIRFATFLQGLMWPGETFCRGCNGTSPCKACALFAETPQRLYQVFASCNELFKSCSWNGRPINCCSNFRTLTTSQGICYSLNSRQTDGSLDESIFVVTKQASNAVLSIECNQRVQVFVHDPNDIGFMKTGRNTKSFARENAEHNTKYTENDEFQAGSIPNGGHRSYQWKADGETSIVPTTSPGERRILGFGMQQVLVDPSAWRLKRGQRQCTLPGELRLSIYRESSHSACLEVCQARSQLRHCNCSHPLFPRFGGDPVCGYDGLLCLDRHFNFGNVKKMRRKPRCRCWSDCAVTDINILRDSISKIDGDTSQTIVQMMQLPQYRFVLKARVDIIDTIVCVACLSRLVTSINLPMIVMSILRFCDRAIAKLLGVYTRLAIRSTHAYLLYTVTNDVNELY